MSGTVQAGDRVLLLEPGTGRRWLLQLDGGGARHVKTLGVTDPDRLAGTPYGATVQVGARTVTVLQPRLGDLLATLRRKAQIITPKDLGPLLHGLGAGPGHRILESGAGSGAATVALAWAVGDAGRVVVQELRQDFADWTQANVERAGLASRVEFHVGDLTEGPAPGIEGPFDAALLDLPEPWRCLPHVLGLLHPGAALACYVPQVSQMEHVVRALRDRGAADVRAVEILERAWEVKERGSRPAFDGLGHTGFLVFGRRLE